MPTSKINKPFSKEQKIKDLQRKRQETLDKLKDLYTRFHGVKHENSSSEIKYIQIKVLEGFVQSIDAELQSLGVKK